MQRTLTAKGMANILKNQDIPKFLLDKHYLAGSVFFILTFSIFFMLLYTPFSMTVWFSVSNIEQFGKTASFYVVALAILSISKIGMYAIQSKIRFTYPKYILWIIAEVVIIALFYTHFTYVFVPNVDDSVWYTMGKAFGCVSLIIAIPYSILTLYAAYRAKTEELEMLQYEMSLQPEPTASYPSLVNLYDYNGTLKLTISSESLYYMESQDNYVKIYYINQGKLSSYMLRCRTKAIEESLAGTSMVRCHRSYMVNVLKIDNIKKGTKGRQIILNNDEIKPIPVSKSYFKNLVETIEKCNSAKNTVAAPAPAAPLPEEEVVVNSIESEAEK